MLREGLDRDHPSRPEYGGPYGLRNALVRRAARAFFVTRVCQRVTAVLPRAASALCFDFGRQGSDGNLDGCSRTPRETAANSQILWFTTLSRFTTPLLSDPESNRFELSGVTLPPILAPTDLAIGGVPLKCFTGRHRGIFLRLSWTEAGFMSPRRCMHSAGDWRAIRGKKRLL